MYRGRMSATGAQLREVEKAPIAMPEEALEPGKILDDHGNTVQPTHRRDSWMRRVDAKVGEDVTLKKGTIAMFGLFFVLLQVAFNYGGSLLGWTADYSSLKQEMIETRKDMAELKQQFSDVQKTLQDQRVKEAEARGYKLGQTDAGASGHK